jgi:hypothetical protein
LLLSTSVTLNFSSISLQLQLQHTLLFLILWSLVVGR